MLKMHYKIVNFCQKNLYEGCPFPGEISTFSWGTVVPNYSGQIIQCSICVGMCSAKYTHLFAEKLKVAYPSNSRLICRDISYSFSIYKDNYIFMTKFFVFTNLNNSYSLMMIMLQLSNWHISI